MRRLLHLAKHLYERQLGKVDYMSLLSAMLGCGSSVWEAGDMIIDLIELHVQLAESVIRSSKDGLYPNDVTNLGVMQFHAERATATLEEEAQKLQNQLRMPQKNAGLGRRWSLDTVPSMRNGVTPARSNTIALYRERADIPVSIRRLAGGFLQQNDIDIQAASSPDAKNLRTDVMDAHLFDSPDNGSELAAQNERNEGTIFGSPLRPNPDYLHDRNQEENIDDRGNALQLCITPDSVA
ncbi:hypothetical protein GY45DRAFT_1127481 [Cubamyces sp. BRFM 1775]|nr:hypothetical protein GY45DRAFT_1127481 [Cubamyces sp. BRFM 1775]